MQAMRLEALKQCDVRDRQSVRWNRTGRLQAADARKPSLQGATLQWRRGTPPLQQRLRR